MKLDRVRRYALSLPETTEEPHFDYSSFRVRGRIFATVPPDGEHVHVFVADEEREIALALEPAIVEKLMWGGRVVGIRVTLAHANRDMVTKLLFQAWSRKAPRRLVALFTAGGAGPVS